MSNYSKIISAKHIEALRNFWNWKKTGIHAIWAFFTDGSKVNGWAGGGVYYPEIELQSLHLMKFRDGLRGLSWPLSLSTCWATQTLHFPHCWSINWTLIGSNVKRLNVPAFDFCRSCLDEEEEESPQLLLKHCPALARLRLKYIGSPFFNSLSELVHVSPTSVSNFMRSTKWFNR